MVNYALIEQKRLRELVMDAISIQSLPEKERAAMVKSIAALPREGRVELTKLLKEEQKKIQEQEAEQQKLLKENLKKMKDIKKSLEKNVRIEHEKTERGQSQKDADDLLKNL